MKITQIHLYLLMWCQAAETLKDQLIDLGQNVTINCDHDEQEVNWVLVKLPDSPLVLLSSSTTASTFYHKRRYKKKFSVQSKHCLFINNVTIDELGVYYCVTRDEPPKYSDGFRIHITGSTPTPEIQNQTVIYTMKTEIQWQIVSLISALLNGVLIIVIIGLLKTFVLGRKRTRNDTEPSQDTIVQQVINLEQQQNTTQVQYARPEFSNPCRKFQCKPINETYALLQLPN